MKTQEYFDTALNTATEARARIAEINADLQRSLNYNKGLLDDGKITESGFNESARGLREDAEERQKAILAGLNSVALSYSDAVKEWSKMDGEKLKEGANDIAMMEAIDLNADEVDALMQKYQNNPTMTRKIGQYWKKRSEQIIQENEKRLSTEQERVYLKVNPQSTDDMIKDFNSYIEMLKMSTAPTFDAELHGHANAESFANNYCKYYLSRTMSMGGEEYNLEKYQIHEVPKKHFFF
jgi:hypothetical protein